MLESFLNSRTLHRRSFLRVAGATTATSALLLAGCGDDGATTPPADPVLTLPADDTGLLNSVLAPIRLQSAFYETVLATPPTDLTAEDKDLLQQVYDQLTVQQVYLARVMDTGTLNKISEVPYTFASVTLTSRQGVLTAARTLADLILPLYINALAGLTAAFYVQIITKMMSVAGRQAALLHDLLQPGTFADSTVVEASGLFAGLERQRTPVQVFAELNKYLANNISISAASLPTP